MVKVSIITVCYNAEATIRDTLDSIESQTYPNIEHIVVDGLSTDRTVEIVEKKLHANSRIICETDSGLYDAMNKGLRNATGDILGILNSDDLFAHDKVIEHVVSCFDDQTDAIYADLMYVSEDLKTNARLWKSGPHLIKNWRNGWVPPHPTFYARRNVYERFGDFDLTFRLASDYELLFRLIKKERISIKYLPEVLVKMRLGGVTNHSMRNIWDQNREIFSIWDKHQVPLNRPQFMLGKLVNRLIQRIDASGRDRE